MMVDKKETTSFRQQQIAIAAAELVVKCGSEHVTIRQLALQTQMSEAAIYRHFKSKSDIFRFLLKYVETTLLSDLNHSDMRDSAVSFNLDSVIDHHISSIAKSHGVAFQVIAEIISMGNTTLNRDTLKIVQSYIKAIEQIFRKGNVRDAENLAFIFFTLIQGLVNLWALSGYSFNLIYRFKRIWATQKYHSSASLPVMHEG